MKHLILIWLLTNVLLYVSSSFILADARWLRDFWSVDPGWILVRYLYLVLTLTPVFLVWVHGKVT